MEFHKDTIDGLRAKDYEVGELYMQTAADGLSVHQFITVKGIAIPIEVAADLNRGRVTLTEIAAHFAKQSNRPHS